MGWQPNGMPGTFYAQGSRTRPPKESGAVHAFDDYLTQLASSSPTPGGGSAAALVGATGAALVAMVARICRESPSYAPLAGLAAALTERSDGLRADLLAASARDEAAFQVVVAALALPRGTEAERASRTEVLQRALVAAAEAPLHTAESALGVLRLAHESLALGNRHLASDIGCAAEFGSAAIAAAAYNVRVNHGYMTDADTMATQSATLLTYEREASALLVTIRNHFEAGTST